MNVMKILQKVFFNLIIFTFFPIFLFSQELLTNQNTTWTFVLPGKVISEPAITSYGFSLVTDAKQISTYSNSGKLLWEKTLKNYRDSKIFVFPGDFIFLISENNKKITLLNPSGYELWSKNLDFSVISNPHCGFDGRFFLKGENQIECFGISGLSKWKLKTENFSNINLQELPDGSLIAFLEKLEDGKTKGIRISPFGKILEEITFSGQIISSTSSENGIFLTFIDGSAGYFSLEENFSKNKWVLQTEKPTTSSQIKNAKFVVCKETQNTFYILPYENEVVFFRISSDDGKIKNSFIIKNLKGFEIQKIVYNESGIFICDNSKGFFYNENGNEIWSGQFQKKSKKNNWNYIIFTNENYLTFCYTNWTVNSYRIFQNLAKSTQNQKQKNYNSYYTINTSDFEYIFNTKIEADFATEERIKKLQNGNYDTNEIEYVSELMSACEVLKSQLNFSPTTNKNGKSIFELDMIGTAFLLKELSLFSTDTFSSYISQFLLKIQNKSALSEILRGIETFGYDSDGKILTSLEQLAKKTSSKDEIIINDICNAVFSICRFMGRPAFNSKGKEILQNFLFPNYSANTRNYARETLKKITELEL